MKQLLSVMHRGTTCSPAASADLRPGIDIEQAAIGASPKRTYCEDTRARKKGCGIALVKWVFDQSFLDSFCDFFV